MPVGKNIDFKDKLIKKTTSNVSITHTTHRKRKPGQPSLNPKKKTFKTEKMTFYIKRGLLDKLKNFAYWDRHTLTEAFNIVVTDGLKRKNIKQKT